MYILEKQKNKRETQFIKLNDIYEGKRYDAFVQAYDDLLNNITNKHNITLPQEKLKIIDGWPFIYWISDGFREKFKGAKLDEKIKVCSGLSTANNDRFLRFWWEVGSENISIDYANDKKKWVMYCKGGPYKKWAGNLWVTVNYDNNGILLKDNGGTLRNKDFYFREGITCSGRSSSKGVSYRYFPSNHIFDVGATGLIPQNGNNLWYGLALMNSKLTTYMLDCLNPTVNTTEGDLQKVPFIIPSDEIEVKTTSLTKENYQLVSSLDTYCSIETTFISSPLVVIEGNSLIERIINFLSFNNYIYAKVIINEYLINEFIFKVYSLNDIDRNQVENKMGLSLGSLPVTEEALSSFKRKYEKDSSDNKELIFKYFENVSITSFNESDIKLIKDEFQSIYTSNNEFEEFCIRHQINPINIWHWFNESNVIPVAKVKELVTEFLIDTIKQILMEDEDGIVPLIGLPGEPQLLERLETKCYQMGFNSAQFMQLDLLIGKPIKHYLEQLFFKDFSDRINLFMFLPKSPFIWHITSGVYQGFEAFIIIYKWNADSLFKLKSHYINKRVESLDFRLIQIQGIETAQSQTEKETIRLQLKEIEVFTAKIDELIAEGYNPKLDDGVGKNIAPLQKKGLLKADVLKAAQLTKYLNADW